MRRVKYPLAALSLLACSQLLTPAQAFWWGRKATGGLPERVYVHQYEANNPIEDRFDARKLGNWGLAAAVYDGHGGFEVAELAKNDLLAHLCNHANEGDLAGSLTQAYKHVEQTFYEAALKAYRMGFGHAARVGSCALVAVIRGKELVTANTGDCRGIIVNQDLSTVQVNNEHNAARPA
jgi:pyruvate dehydrogenase phosphatase